MRDSGPRIVTRLAVATVIAGLLTGVAGVLLVQALERADLRREAAERKLAVAERTATIIDGEVDALVSQLALLASRSSVASLQPESATTGLAVALRVSGQLEEVVLFTATGEPVAAAASARLIEPQDVERRPSLTVSTTNRPGTATIASAEGPAKIEIVVPVESPPGRVAGHLVGLVSVEPLLLQAEARLLGPEAAAFLVSKDGTIIAHPERDRALRRERFPLDEVFPPDVRAVAAPSDEGRLIYARAETRTLPAVVVVQRPEALALADLGSDIDEITAVFVSVVGVIVLAVLLLGRRLLQPLGPLTDAARRLESGDLDARVEHDGRAGELAVLADGFDRMAAALQERQSELAEAERSARRSEARLRVMIEGVEDYAILLLNRNGAITSWNTGARRLTGRDEDEAVGRPLADVLELDLSDEDPMAEAGREGRSQYEGWCRRADGRRFWAQMVVTKLTDEATELSGFVLVVHDQTERRAARRTLEQALQREQQASAELRDLNELKDEFLAIAAHELQTPLSAILGASALLSDGSQAGDGDSSRFGQIVIRHARDMRQVVARLLDLSRLQGGRVAVSIESVSLHDELRSNLERLEHELSSHRVSLEAANAEVHTDPDALRHIVTNLLTNAAKFSPSDATIRVRGEVEESAFTVTVADQGPGIDPADHDVIFELFRQGSSHRASTRGTGIGLAIVSRYVEMLGGTIALDSRPGEGATFTVRLPSRPVEGQ